MNNKLSIMKILFLYLIVKDKYGDVNSEEEDSSSSESEDEDAEVGNFFIFSHTQ